jgi:glycosyltransferase involved in cell wall biosynthesis
LLKISGTVITLDEAENIARAIRSLSVCDEIIIVDAGSRDGTQAIARQLGARVIERPFSGFAAQKNFAAEQAQHNWILSLDADEELDLDAQDAVREWKSEISSTAEPLAAGYRFARRARYLGRWILHSGWYPDWKLRLYDRRTGHWQGDYVHESVVVNGTVQTLTGEILHHTCDSLHEHYDRLEFYTDLAAREMIERGKVPTLIERVFVPGWTFLSTYLFRLGVLDGYQGLLIAWMAARYVNRKYSKWAARKEEQVSSTGRQTGLRTPM